MSRMSTESRFARLLSLGMGSNNSFDVRDSFSIAIVSSGIWAEFLKEGTCAYYYLFVHDNGLLDARKVFPVLFFYASCKAFKRIQGFAQ